MATSMSTCVQHRTLTPGSFSLYFRNEFHSTSHFHTEFHSTSHLSILSLTQPLTSRYDVVVHRLRKSKKILNPNPLNPKPPTSRSCSCVFAKLLSIDENRSSRASFADIPLCRARLWYALSVSRSLFEYYGALLQS